VKRYPMRGDERRANVRKLQRICKRIKTILQKTTHNFPGHSLNIVPPKFVDIAFSLLVPPTFRGHSEFAKNCPRFSDQKLPKSGPVKEVIYIGSLVATMIFFCYFVTRYLIHTACVVVHVL